jgi:hypothetical protein
MNKIFKFFRNIYLRVMINIELKRFYKLYIYYIELESSKLCDGEAFECLEEINYSICNKLIELYDLE